MLVQIILTETILGNHFVPVRHHHHVNVILSACHTAFQLNLYVRVRCGTRRCQIVKVIPAYTSVLVCDIREQGVIETDGFSISPYLIIGRGVVLIVERAVTYLHLKVGVIQFPRVSPFGNHAAGTFTPLLLPPVKDAALIPCGCAAQRIAVCGKQIASILGLLIIFKHQGTDDIHLHAQIGE